MNHVCKDLFFVLAFLSVSSIASGMPVEYVQCRTGSASLGESKSQVIAKCGQPITEDRRIFYTGSEGSVATTIIDEVTYDEPGIHATLIFRNGVLVEIIRK